ncbi:hypothetical protein [Bacillus sp. JJ1773]|uniref:hypothetical protein n=1 Tax=Bacillus sp. JJ1773 TaxID=3122965 RepID=UPI002FFFA543
MKSQKTASKRNFERKITILVPICAKLSRVEGSLVLVLKGKVDHRIVEQDHTSGKPIMSQ